MELLIRRRAVPPPPWAACAVAALLAACSALPASRCDAQTESLEFAVKANYLFKLAPFVEWPAGAADAASAVPALCTVGSDPVTELVDEVAATMPAERAPAVRHLSLASLRDAKCPILYIALSEGQATRALEAVRGAPVLTVTDAPASARAKGIVNFVIVNNRVRFEIDLVAAGENGLVVSSKLLELAARVRRP